MLDAENMFLVVEHTMLVWRNGENNCVFRFIQLSLDKVLFCLTYWQCTLTKHRKQSHISIFSPYFLEGFQQAHTVTKVIRTKMPPVERMTYRELLPSSIIKTLQSVSSGISSKIMKEIRKDIGGEVFTEYILPWHLIHCICKATIVPVINKKPVFLLCLFLSLERLSSLTQDPFIFSAFWPNLNTV